MPRALKIGRLRSICQVEGGSVGTKAGDYVIAYTLP